MGMASFVFFFAKRILQKVKLIIQYSFLSGDSTAKLKVDKG